MPGNQRRYSPELRRTVVDAVRSGVSQLEAERRYGVPQETISLWARRDTIGLPSGGAIRASLGLASNFADLHRFQQFAAQFTDLTSVPDDLPPRNTC
jgi:hypothetical protein